MFKAQILGRLGRDAQIFKSANGSEFLTFTLAVNTRNQGSDITYWVDVRSFNPNHLKLHKYLTKGKILQVGGDLNTAMTTDKLGVVRVNHNILSDYITFVNLGSKNGEKTADNSSQASEIPNNDISSQASEIPINNISSHAVATHNETKSMNTDEDNIVMNSPVANQVHVASTVGSADDDTELPF